MNESSYVKPNRLTIDDCLFWISDVSMLGAKARVQAHIQNQQSTINNHQSTIINQQSTIINQQSTINNRQSAIGNHQSSSHSASPI